MTKPWEVEYKDVGAVVAPWQREYEAPPGAALSTGERVMKGVTDPISGGAQLLESALPKAITDPVNKVNNFLAQYGLVAPVSPEGLGADVAQQEQEYARRLKATPGFEDGGVDWARIVGSGISPANLAMAYSAPAGLLGRLATGAGMGLAQPTGAEGSEFWEDKAVQGSLGAAGMGISDLATRAIGKVVSPWASRNPTIQQLRSEGVHPSLGQLLGPRASRMEQGLSSAPLLGGGIREARSKAFEEFNLAAANRVLKPIGESVEKGVKPGFELVDDVAARVGRHYDQLLPKLQGQLDKPLKAELQSIKASVTLPKAQQDQLNRILRDEVTKRFDSNGVASGESIKNIESKLGQLARGYIRDPDYDKRAMGYALRDTQKAVRDMLDRVNPVHAKELQPINQAWANLLRLENAAARAGNAEGIFTPAQLNAAIKATDTTRGKKLFSHGKASMQDLARAGQQVLGTTVPDSGTAFRTAMGLGMLGGGYAVHPGILGMELAAMAPYTRAGQLAANTLLASRPTWAEPLAGGLRAMAPYLASPVSAGVANAATIPSDQ